MVCIFSFLLSWPTLGGIPFRGLHKGSGTYVRAPEGDFPRRLPPAFINKLFKFR